MIFNNEGDKRVWYRLPLKQNPKAIIPLCLSVFGSLCWQAVALFCGYSHNRSQDLAWDVLVPVGIVFMLVGLAESFVYRRYRVALVALIVSLCSPPLWSFVSLADMFGTPTWLPLPLTISEYSIMHPLVIWLYFQLPLAIFVLWRIPWKRRIKAAITILAAIGLLGFFEDITVQARREVAAAPYVSSEYISSIYTKNDTSAIERLSHKRIVVTGPIYGDDDGLFGSPGPYRMDEIDFSDLVGNTSLTNGDTVSIVGTLEGKDKYGEIRVYDSRVIEQ